MSTNELVSKVRELKELQAMAEELQAEINSIQVHSGIRKAPYISTRLKALM